MKNPIAGFFLYLIVFMTGAAGLIYQVTWQKYLTRLLGSDSIATAIILATFLGGLSLGYYLCGKFTTRVRNHFKAYAYLEAIIGMWCLFFPSLFALLDRMTLSWSFQPPLVIVFQGFLCSALLMGIPTVCMGGTIPFLTRGISRSISEATRVHAKVYAINTAGAFLGTLLAGFYLIPAKGLPVTMMETALLNIFAFLFFFVFSRYVPVRDESPDGPAPGAGGLPPGEPQGASRGYPSAVLYVIAFLSGFYVMTLENVLIRITNLSLGSSTYSFSMIVSVFILSIAVGSYVLGRMPGLARSVLFVNQLFITLLLLAVYFSLDTWPYWAHIIRVLFQSHSAGFWGYYSYILIALTLVLILPVGFMGATVPIAFHELKRELQLVGKDSGTLFSWNTLGNLTGSLIGGIVFFYFMDNPEVFLTAAALAALSACLSGWFLSKRLFAAGVAAFAAAALLLALTPGYHQNNFSFGTFMLASPIKNSFQGPGRFFESIQQGTRILSHDDGPSASVVVAEDKLPDPVFGKKSRAIIVNGKPDSSTLGDIYTLKLSAHLPALLSPRRDNIMVIGLGTGVTAGEFTLYPDVQRIEVAEISPAVVDALPYFKSFTNDVQSDPRLQITIGDAYRILGRSKRKWDIIVSEPSNPWVTGVDMLFTLEFYKRVKSRLTPDGVLLQWVQMYNASPDMVGMVVNTVQQVFLQSRVFIAIGGDLLILATNKKISGEDLQQAERLIRRNDRVRKSLAEIDIRSLDGILIRELWPPSYLPFEFSGYGIQFMDVPKLHYIAGKNNFTQERVPNEFLRTSRTVIHLRDYLMVKKYPDWATRRFSRSTLINLLDATWNKVLDLPTPLEQLVKLKAYLQSPDEFPMSPEEKLKSGADLVPVITGQVKPDDFWDKNGFKHTSDRTRAEALLDVVNRFRNWIVPFSQSGLIAFLEAAAADPANAPDKDWLDSRLKLLKKQSRLESIF